MSRALKLAKRELTRLGCPIIYKGPGKLKFQLTGSEWVCTSDTTLAVVRSVIAHERGRVRVETGNKLEAFPAAQTWDVLAEGDFYVSKHCRERFELMRGQGLRSSELVAAILTPEIVRMSSGRTLLYCAGRIAVAVGKRVNGKYPLVTVLWATDELWELNPRPEKELHE